ncbi:MAG: alpha/beta fold hydrolase [Pseudomonadota bacterium]
MAMKLLGIISVLVLVVLCIVLWCTPATHHLRFRDTGLNTHLVVQEDDSFQHYIAVSKEIIKLARTQGGVNNTETVVTENSPLQLLPDEKDCPRRPDHKFENGILLIHGFLDSTYTMNFLGQFFRDKCFAVYIILLPGHGTVPGDLLQVNYQDWIKATHFGATKIAEQAKNIYLMGYSLGGLLAVHEILQNPGAYKGALLFGPCLGLKTSYSALVAPVYWLSQLIPRLKWLSVRSDDINVKYESYPLNPVYQIVKLVAKVRDELGGKSLNIPVFMQQSADDMTVDAQVNLDFFEKNHPALSKLLWYSENPADKNLADPRIKFIFGALPEQKILDMSHLSYLMPASDPIYGLHGEYHDCLFYKIHSPEWQQCKTGTDNYLGEVTAENVKTHLVQRLTFNPFEKVFLDELAAFIDAVGKS